MTLLERQTGMVWWPRNRDPWIKGPQPRLITFEPGTLKNSILPTNHKKVLA